MHTLVYMWKSQDNLREWFALPLRRSWGLNSGSHLAVSLHLLSSPIGHDKYKTFSGPQVVLMKATSSRVQWTSEVEMPSLPMEGPPNRRKRHYRQAVAMCFFRGRSVESSCIR